MVCSKCNKAKPLSEFGKRNDRPKSYKSACKECSSKERRLSRYQFRDLQHLEDMLNHNTECNICGYVFNIDAEKCIDHCHSSGKIRGVLCHHCNTTLGKIEKIGINKFLNYGWK